MTNIEYIQKMTTINDYIYADTSALLDADWLRSFSEKAEPIFMAAGKKVTIPTSVRAELLRHFDSPDSEKRSRAHAAVEILANHKELFQTTDDLINDDDIAAAFADAELLTLLMVNRRGHRQLLIANDRNLTSDAFNLNNQESCHGGKISVCYVNRFGGLQCCDCVPESNLKKIPGEQSPGCMGVKLASNGQALEDQIPNSKDNSFISAIPQRTEDGEIPVDDTDENKGIMDGPSVNKNKSGWKFLLAFSGGAAGGYAAGRYGKAIARFIKAILFL